MKKIISIILVLLILLSLSASAFCELEGFSEKTPKKVAKPYTAIKLEGVSETLYAYTDKKGETKFRVYGKLGNKTGYFAVSLSKLDDGSYSIALDGSKKLNETLRFAGVPKNSKDKLTAPDGFRATKRKAEFYMVNFFGKKEFVVYASFDGENYNYYPSVNGRAVAGSLPVSIEAMQMRAKVDGQKNYILPNALKKGFQKEYVIKIGGEEVKVRDILPEIDVPTLQIKGSKTPAMDEKKTHKAADAPKPKAQKPQTQATQKPSQQEETPATPTNPPAETGNPTEAPKPTEETPTTPEQEPQPNVPASGSISLNPSQPTLNSTVTISWKVNNPKSDVQYKIRVTGRESTIHTQILAENALTTQSVSYNITQAGQYRFAIIAVSGNNIKGVANVVVEVSNPAPTEEYEVTYEKVGMGSGSFEGEWSSKLGANGWAKQMAVNGAMSHNNGGFAESVGSRPYGQHGSLCQSLINHNPQVAKTKYYEYAAWRRTTKNKATGEIINDEVFGCIRGSDDEAYKPD